MGRQTVGLPKSEALRGADIETSPGQGEIQAVSRKGEKGVLAVEMRFETLGGSQIIYF